VVIIRACSVFGPHDRDFLAYFKLAAKGIVLTLKKKKEASLVYVKDLAEALWLCAGADVPSGETFNIADSRTYTLDDLGKAVAGALGRGYRRVKVPTQLLYLVSLLYETAHHLKRKAGILDRDKYRELTQPGWVLDVKKATEMLSFRARYTLDEAVRETTCWYIAERWL